MILRQLRLPCLFALTTGAALAQNLDLPYSSGSTGADGPFIIPAGMPASSAFGMAYDGERQEVVRYHNGQTWLFRAAGWQLMTPAVSPTTARSFPAMAFDDARNEVVLFGGLGTSRLNDTWVWDGTTWTQKSPATSPPERSESSMCWDPTRQQIVLFGGKGTSGLLQDTWVWNGTDWTQKTPTTVPSARLAHAMAPYPPTSTVAMCCGNTVGPGYQNSALTDLWLWDGDNWTSQGGPLPSCEFPSMVYDPIRAVLLVFGGYRVTGSAGAGFATTILSSLTSWKHGRGAVDELALPPSRYQHGGVWHAAQNRMIIAGGKTSPGERSDTWAWNGTSWLGMTAPDYTFDLTTKPEAIWNFTSIQVPSGTTVRFNRNAANQAVLWLASESVVVDGTIDASGSGGVKALGAAGGVGGPGGFNGGTAATSTTAPTPGMGPGGGAAGTPGVNPGVNGGNGTHADVNGAGPYGTLFAQPAVGGSGGGGRAYASLYNSAASGGGGGGAVVIASSRDITVNGSILARGGAGGGNNGQDGFGGNGSGGLIRLIGDRIILGGGGLVDAGDPNATGKGRARLEAYIRVIPNVTTQVKGSRSLSVPVLGSVLTQAGGRLWFAKVAGANVANPPMGDAINPDVVFTAEGSVEVEVHALNVPDGTPVTVTINHSIAGVINLPAVTLAQCKAVFTATIPAGSGVMQSFATYNVGGPAPAP